MPRPARSGALRCETPAGTWKLTELEGSLSDFVEVERPVKFNEVVSVTMEAAGTKTVAQSASSVWEQHIELISTIDSIVGSLPIQSL